MVSDELSSAALAELDSIANAAMTAGQRESRAGSIMHEVTVAELCDALRNPDLPWNRRKAGAFGVSRDAWQEALTVAGVNECDSLGKLLAAIHKAESAAAMLRAGYRPELSVAGKLSWSR